MENYSHDNSAENILLNELATISFQFLWFSHKYKCYLLSSSTNV
jgi:hypothetical protein